MCIIQDDGHFLLITLYIDDMLFINNSKDVICDLKSELLTQFYMKVLGVKKYILGMDIKRDIVDIRIWLRLSKYLNYMLQCFCMVNCRTLSVLIFMGTKHIFKQDLATLAEMEDMDFLIMPM